MPQYSGNLTGTPLANNFNRSRDSMSSYGTRTLMFYAITIDGYNIWREPGWSLTQSEVEVGNPDYYTNFPYNPYRVTDEGESYLESPRSIEYPILRGIAQVGEIMLNGELKGSSGTGALLSGHTYLVVALSMDTVADGHYMAFTENSKRISDAIKESIYEFAPDAVVHVVPQYIYGLTLTNWITPTGSNS
jgi:hypothetical protein